MEPKRKHQKLSCFDSKALQNFDDNTHSIIDSFLYIPNCFCIPSNYLFGIPTMGFIHYIEIPHYP